MYCDHCLKDNPVVRTDGDEGRFLCCNICGKVLEDDPFIEEETDVEDSCSERKLATSNLRMGESYFAAKFEWILNSACAGVEDELERLGVEDDSVVQKVVELFRVYLVYAEENQYHYNIREDNNEEYLEELAAKEEVARNAFETFFENRSSDLLSSRELAASATKALAEFRKEAPENLQKVQVELPSENDNNLESRSKAKMKEDELGSFDDFKHTLYSRNGGSVKRICRFVPRKCMAVMQGHSKS